MTKIKLAYLIVVLATLITSAKAQFNMGAEYRPRFEFRDGYGTLKTADNDPAYFVTQRTRLNINHTYNKLKTRLSIQDYRIWGESKLKSDDLGVNVFEAWFQLQMNDYWSFTAGRQSFDVDNKRLFSAANWNQLSASHDGLSLDFAKKTLTFKMFTAFNQAKVVNFGTDYSDQISNYKFLNVIWLEQKFKNVSLANLTITDGYQKVGTTATDYYRFTSGLVFKYKKAANDLQLRGFYQTGKSKTGQEVDAYYVSGSYANQLNSKISLTGGFEYMSGKDLTDATNSKDNAFDILYGTRHGYNGIMDYFSTPNTSKDAGLVDVYLMADITKFKNWKLSVQYHYFALANKYVYENEVQDRFLANEIDLIANYKLNESVDLQLGYAMLFGSETLEHVKGVEADGLQQFFYTMITVKPNFLRINDE